MTKQIACLVEGHGDVEGVPIIVRRLAQRSEPEVTVHVSAPLRTPKSKLVKPGELERAVEFVARRIARHGAVLVVIDSDDDCPANLGPALLNRVNQANIGVAVAVVLAHKEIESWFVAAANSLAGVAGLLPGLVAPPDPESIRGAKEWLTQRMAGNRSYSPTVDQALLSTRFDLESAMAADSFTKFAREVERLIREAPNM